jgi:hypothetical protein
MQMEGSAQRGPPEAACILSDHITHAVSDPPQRGWNLSPNAPPPNAMQTNSYHVCYNNETWQKEGGARSAASKSKDCTLRDQHSHTILPAIECA